jgi:hypothetical protein
MTDNAPVVSEFLPNAATCRGDYTGCAICATAATLLRYGKPVPTTNGIPNMRNLGDSMGLLHRRADAHNRHGLSLTGLCTPPNSGTNWCAYCAYLYLKNHGLPVHYGALSDTAIKNHLSAGHTLIIPGLYSRVPLVSETSYSRTVPAKGRSDSGFGGTHMVAAHGLSGSYVIVTDSDFGSSSRPTVPPHSLWPWTTFLSFYHALGWGITYVDAKPPSGAVTPIPPTAPGVVLTAPTPTERNVMIPQGGLTVTSSHVMALAKGQPLFRHPGGPKVTAMSVAGKVAYIGTAGAGWRAVQVSTGAPYGDHVARRTVLYVPAAAGAISVR